MPACVDKHVVAETAVLNVRYAYSGFLGDFPPRAAFHRLAELEVAARKLPAVLAVLADSMAQQQPVAIPYHDTDTYMRPAVHAITGPVLFTSGNGHAHAVPARLLGFKHGSVSRIDKRLE